MTAEHWQQMKEIFYAALDCPERGRAAFLAEACAGDAELLAEIEALLAAHARPGDFIDSPAYEDVAELVVQSRSLLGEQLGAFRIIDRLGAGGMGEVYLAQDTRLGRQVALKLLPEAFTNDPERLHRFQRESRAASALNHPNIVTIYEVGEARGLHFIAAEFVAGQTLRQRLADGALDLGEALAVTTQVASALAVAHAAGIVHRDIKPENVMVRPDGLVKVLDFGLAKLTGLRIADCGLRVEKNETPVPISNDNPQSTTPGVVMGTFNYMSPEQARGLRVDARSDIFSLGVLARELITGQAPFTGPTPSDVIAAILTHTPPPLQNYRAEVPAGLQLIVAKALRKDLEERYQSSEELLADLQGVKQEWEFSAKRADGIPSGGRGLAAASVIAGRRRSLWLALAGVLVVGAAIALYARSNWRGSVSGPPPHVVPVTTFAGREDYVSFSPDGNQLAFAWDGGGNNLDIYVKLIGAGAPLRLTTDPAEDSYPVWSPDGRYIAFIRQTQAENGIYLVPALGGVERKLGQTVPNTSGLAWSPDGKFLAVTDQSRSHAPQGISLLSLGTLEKRDLTVPPVGFGDTQPAFSPDGQYLAFVRNGNANTGGIYLQPMSGGEPRLLTNENRVVDGLAWTADSRAVVFSSNRAGSYNLWRVAIAASGGSTPEAVAVAGRDVHNPAISRQGNRLAYNERYLDSNIWRVEGLTAAKGRRGAPTKLISSTREDHSPQFSPDGRKIAFVSDRSGGNEIWVCDSDGSNPLQLTSFGGLSTGSPRWSPDGRQIAFDSGREGQVDIFVIAAEGGQPRALTTETSYDILPCWSHDGRWVYFCSNRGGSWQLWKLPISGGPAVQVTRQGGFEAFESPDGRLLFYTKGRGPGGIWQVPVEGGEEQAVPELTSAGHWRYWAVASDGIYFVAKEKSVPPGIKFFSFARRQVLPVAVLEKEPLMNPPGLCVSPDGRWLLLVQADQSIDDLMLVENFR